MQKPVHDVQFDLAPQRIAKFAGVPSCGFDTDKNFAFMKGYDVGRTGFAEEPKMQLRDMSIGNEADCNSVQLTQVSSFVLLQLQTTAQSVIRKPFQVGDVDFDFSLTITHGDGGCFSHLTI
jgi:hypothetical protein